MDVEQSDLRRGGRQNKKKFTHVRRAHTAPIGITEGTDSIGSNPCLRSVSIMISRSSFLRAVPLGRVIRRPAVCSIPGLSISAKPCSAKRSLSSGYLTHKVYTDSFRGSGSPPPYSHLRRVFAAVCGALYSGREYATRGGTKAALISQ